MFKTLIDQFRSRLPEIFSRWHPDEHDDGTADAHRHRPRSSTLDAMLVGLIQANDHFCQTWSFTAAARYDRSWSRSAGETETGNTIKRR